MSLRRFSTLLGVDPSAVFKYESGKTRVPRTDVLIKIVELAQESGLEISLSELIDDGAEGE